MTAAAPIMVRARITRDEWREVQKRALDENRASADLLADAIRLYMGQPTGAAGVHVAQGGAWQPGNGGNAE